MKTFGNQTRLVRTSYIEKMKNQVRELSELRIQHEKLARYHRRKMHESNVVYAQCLLRELPKVNTYACVLRDNGEFSTLHFGIGTQWV
jgi:hypothetical protein